MSNDSDSHKGLVATTNWELLIKRTTLVRYLPRIKVKERTVIVENESQHLLNERNEIAETFEEVSPLKRVIVFLLVMAKD